MTIDRIEASAWFAKGYRDYYELRLDEKLTHIEVFALGSFEEALDKRECYEKGIDKAMEDYWFDRGHIIKDGRLINE